MAARDSRTIHPPGAAWITSVTLLIRVVLIGRTDPGTEARNEELKAGTGNANISSVPVINTSNGACHAFQILMVAGSYFL